MEVTSKGPVTDLVGDLSNDGLDIMGKESAIGVAHNKTCSSGVECNLQRRKGKVGIRSISVEEMFGVKEHLSSFVSEERNGVANHGNCLVE